MKIRSNVKAGGMQLQHNEKMASDNNTIEQKRALTPFFARKLQGKSVVVKTGIKAGACESNKK